MKDFYWWAKSILMLQKALTQIKKKNQLCLRKARQTTNSLGTSNAISQAACIALTAWQISSAEVEPEPLL